jgi:D-beta-D-heptose 7-phosphate kinase/D-beta-D-heptose 1-phosphate adenosyltransferase
MIYNTIEELAKYLESYNLPYRHLVATSGGFDPIHIGHLRCIQQSKQSLHDILVVIVNGDGFLTRKKGKPFMPLAERMEIIDGLRGVDFVTTWDDGSQNVIGALEILKPHLFAKGGDRSSADKVPEAEVCAKIGCTILYGVGGTDKVQSSSNLIKNSKEDKIKYLDPNCEHNWVLDGHNAGEGICSKCLKRE